MTPLKEGTQLQSSRKSEHSKQQAVVIIHMLAYGQSQVCNWMQRDVANFIHYHGLSDTGMQALHCMGVCTGSATFYADVHNASKSHLCMDPQNNPGGCR